MKIKKNLQIAIDGPVSSGTSTLASILAKKLNLLFVNTGVMYRTATYLYLKAKKQGNTLSEKELVKLVHSKKIVLCPPSKPKRHCDVSLDGKDITNKLYKSEISNLVPVISKISKLRQHLVSLQQQLAKNKAVVMEGRDIASVVLPNADLKIFLTADLDTRIKRRLFQKQQSGQKISFETMKKEITRRDALDTTRSISPLQKIKDAWLVDTTNLTIDQTVKLVIQKLKNLNLIKT